MARTGGAAVVVALFFLFGGDASAGTLGQLSPLNCFSTQAVTGCTSQPGVDGAGGLGDGVTVSPDGKSLYAIMSLSTLAEFRIESDGSLAYVTCIGDTSLGGSNPCPLAAPGLGEGGGGSGSIAVSPDGAHVYVTGYASDAVAVFRRDTGGATLGNLTSEGCLANTSVTTCDSAPGTTHAQAPGLDGPYGVAVSPDGANVYVASLGSKAVVVLKRDLSGVTFGRISSDGCIAYTGVTTCDAVAGSTHGQAPGLELPDGIALSPDGASVYVTDAFEAIAVFLRDTSGTTPGRLTSDGCLAQTGQTKCDGVAGSTKGQAPGLGNPQEPVVSPDGKNVYVGGQANITVLKRDGTGTTPARLTGDGCLAATGASLCDGVSGSTSGRAIGASSKGIAISPDGKNVYSSDYGSSILGAFTRTDVGGLVSDGCLADTGITTCDSVAGATKGQAPGLKRPSGLAAAPGGTSVYTASDDPGSVTALARYVPPPPPPPPTQSPPAPTNETAPTTEPAAQPPAPTLTIISVGVGRTGVISVRVAITTAGSVRAAATFKVKVKRRSASARTRTVKFGSASAVRTSAGNVLLRVKPRRAAKALLRAAKRRVKVTVTFTPTSGTPLTGMRTVKVKLAKPR